MSLEIDAERLTAEIEYLARISDSTYPSVTRVLFSAVDLRARSWLKRLYAEAGLAVREDAVGNTFARWIGADSLHYLTIPGLMRAIGRGPAQEFCRACFDGSYPVPVPQQLEMDKMQFELPLKSDHVPGPPSPQLVG